METGLNSAQPSEGARCLSRSVWFYVNRQKTVFLIKSLSVQISYNLLPGLLKKIFKKNSQKAFLLQSDHNTTNPQLKPISRQPETAMTSSWSDSCCLVTEDEPQKRWRGRSEVSVTHGHMTYEKNHMFCDSFLIRSVKKCIKRV